ncbi:hypothetical protein MCUN1_000774 [Malassezia cuniculi]|uniref:WD repeat-containing protein WRAP73 n=1 Tax=Malassezia cuniculi TaxID=948313 RepID=A0AAF0JA38_9BASI|nr:hypothetical protein MCUN1_000774 [Malassezia cuniculi]
MDFTATYRHAARECIAFSPGSTFIAYVGGPRGTKVLVRVSGTLQIVRQWEFEQAINSLSWSRDGLFLLASAHTTCKVGGVSYVLPLDPDAVVDDGSDDGRGWVAKLDAGPAGLHSADWLPVSRIPAVCQFSCFGIRAVISSLVDQALFVVPNTHPILLSSPAWPEHYGVVQRENEVDYIALYRSSNLDAPNIDTPVEWVRERAIRLHTRNLNGVKWSPDGNYLCAWEHHLEYKAHVYALSGAHLATFQQINGKAETTVAGSLVNRSLKASQTTSSEVSGSTLGIRHVCWHPSSQFLALGGCDEAVRILTSTDWTEAYTLDLSDRNVNTTVWSEPHHWFEATGGRGIVALERVSGPFELRSPSTDRGDSVGISELAWNASGSFLAAVNDAVPEAVFIFSFSLSDGVHLEGIMHLNMPVRTLSWNPKGDSLAAACETSAVYIWNGTSPEAVAVPNDGFSTMRVEWSPDGNALLLAAQTSFCCAVNAEQDTQ